MWYSWRGTEVVPVTNAPKWGWYSEASDFLSKLTFVYFPNEYFEWLIYPRFSLHASTKVIFSFSSKKNMKAKKKKTKERTAFGFYTFFYFQQQDIKESKCKQKMRINRGRWLTSGHRTRQMGFLLLFSKYNNNKY